MPKVLIVGSENETYQRLFSENGLEYEFCGGDEAEIFPGRAVFHRSFNGIFIALSAKPSRLAALRNCAQEPDNLTGKAVGSTAIPGREHQLLICLTVKFPFCHTPQTKPFGE